MDRYKRKLGLRVKQPTTSAEFVGMLETTQIGKTYHEYEESQKAHSSDASASNESLSEDTFNSNHSTRFSLLERMLELNRKEIEINLEMKSLKNELLQLNTNGLSSESLYLGTTDNGSVVFGAPHAFVRIRSGMSKWYSEGIIGMYIMYHPKKCTI